jgi:hypothetical protein
MSRAVSKVTLKMLQFFHFMLDAEFKSHYDTRSLVSSTLRM